MLYIGFSDYSHKILAKVFCNKYKHCAPIIVNKDSIEIYQFVHINKMVKIDIRKKDLQTLEKHGWKLVKVAIDIKQTQRKHYLTCVQFTKAVCGIKNIRIQTPLALFRYLMTK
ncbi:MAG: hypothetical protein IK122_00195 [Alphaproteobacteria bacterium]|nr:hypothetical protein [Alphaproteobacteria bacterium]